MKKTICKYVRSHAVVGAHANIVATFPAPFMTLEWAHGLESWPSACCNGMKAVVCIHWPGDYLLMFEVQGLESSL